MELNFHTIQDPYSPYSVYDLLVFVMGADLNYGRGPKRPREST